MNAQANRSAQISKYFNWSDKVIDVEELLLRAPRELGTSIPYETGVLSAMAKEGYKDGAEHTYLSEMKLKEAFSKQALSTEERARKFTRLQAAMDQCEDHTARVEAGALKPVTFR